MDGGRASRNRLGMKCLPIEMLVTLLAYNPINGVVMLVAYIPIESGMTPSPHGRVGTSRPGS